jgi:hypothetical protein
MTTRSQFTSALAELRESSLKLVKASEALLEIARGDKETANEPHLESPSAETASENKPASLADVRTMLAEKSRAGFTAEVRALILAHGADKLSGIDPSEYAQEGTDAHTLCEYKLRTLLGMDAADPTGNLDSYNAEMEECADNYAAYVLELLASTKETCPDPVVLVEQRVDFSRYVENGFGTADCIVIADGGYERRRLQARQRRGGVRGEQSADDAVCARRSGDLRLHLRYRRDQADHLPAEARQYQRRRNE